MEINAVSEAYHILIFGSLISLLFATASLHHSSSHSRGIKGWQEAGLSKGMDRPKKAIRGRLRTLLECSAKILISASHDLCATWTTTKGNVDRVTF